VRRGRALLVLIVAALLPLIAPAAWLHHGGFPDVAVLVVVYVALESGAAPAAWCGAAMGFLACPWTDEPLGQHAFLLGCAGFAIGVVRQSFNRDLVSVQLALVAIAAMAVHVTSAGLAAGVVGALRAVPGGLLTAATTAIVSPPVFGLLDAARLFRRRRRGVARV